MLAPTAALIASMISLQFGASIATMMFASVGAAGTTALRLGLAATIMAVVTRPWRQAVPRAAVPWLLAYGASLGCMNLLFYLSLRGVPLGVAVALEFVGPLAVTLGHARRLEHAAWLVLSVAGLGLLLPVLHRVQHVSLPGAGCALGAGACWAAYIVCGPRAGAEIGTRAATIGTAIAALLVVPIGLAEAGTRLLAPPVLAHGVVVAVLSSALPYTLEMIALTRLPTRVFGTLTSLEPAVAALVGLLMLHQRLSVPQWAGILAIMTAAAGALRGARHPAEPM